MEDKRCKWDKFKKPPENICPRKFCFMWSENSNRCRETFGLCSRLASDKSCTDWYEPCEPEFGRYGLSWFYSIPNVKNLVEERREEYIKESKKLWGND